MMAKREKKPVHKVVMTEGKRQIIRKRLAFGQRPKARRLRCNDQEMMYGREQKCSRFILLDKKPTWSLDLKGGFYENHKNGDFRIFGGSNHFIRHFIRSSEGE